MPSIEGTEKFSEFKLVEDPSTVAAGWVLLDHYYKDVEKDAITGMPIFVPPDDRWSSGLNGDPIQEKKCTVSHVLRVPVFLFGKRENKKLEELTELVAELRGEGREAHMKMTEQKAAIDGAALMVKDLQEQLKGAKASGDRNYKALKEANKGKNELEADMAKVVAEIGEAKWREIINGE